MCCTIYHTTQQETPMPISVANTTLNLSQIDQLREIVLQTNNILGTSIDPFTLQNLNKSEWWQYEFARQVLSTTLVSEGYDPLPDFTISDLNNGQLPIVLINYINASLLGGGVLPQYLLSSVGAVEATDGSLQRFTYDGVTNIASTPAWYAEIEAVKRIPQYEITLKMPDVVVGGEVVVLVANKAFEPSDLTSTTATKYVRLKIALTEGDATLRVEDTPTPSNSTNTILPTPAQGDLISLVVTPSTVVYGYGSAVETLPLPNGFFTGSPNVIVTSVGGVGVPSLSIIANPYIPVES